MVRKLTRRDFMKGSAATVLGASMALPAKQTGRSKVVLVRDEAALDENSAFNGEVIQQMFDQAVMTLFDADTPQAAMRSIISPNQTVGIKTNVWSYLPTPAEVENAIKQRVLDVGVSEDRIGIDDHGVRTNPLFQNAHSIINARPLRTHYLSGVSGCMKNLIMFSDSQSKWHPNSCADLGLLQTLPEVRGKLRLHVLSVLTPQFHGRGPHHFSRRYVWDYKGILMGRDPVAVDTVGLELIKAKRRQVLGKAKELPPVPKHIELADTKHGIGVGDLNRIELIRLGWQQDILI